MMATNSQHQLRLLKPVSRSFYLSIRFLPEAMRLPCATGYLLARASDTIADRSRAPAAVRIELLERFRDLSEQGFSPADASQNLASSVRDALPGGGASDGEEALLGELDACFAQARELRPPLDLALRQVLADILEGQLLDLRRFETGSGELQYLDSAQELTRYADWVAGSVARYWTRIAAATVEPLSSLPVAELETLGTRYGRALQWLNILRDLHEDLPQGRCYLPKDELVARGWPPSADAEKPRLLAEAAGPWLRAIASGLDEGAVYTDSLRNRRLRFATALPALIGAATLRRIHDSNQAWVKERVKISRSEVRRLMVSAMWLTLAGKPMRPVIQASIGQPGGRKD